jgi:uncharacterized damage-inducible protein DinB
VPTARPFDDAALLDELEFQRALVVRKVAGLTRDQATAVALPSGPTLLGVVRHLTLVETEWFHHLVAGEPMAPWDSDESFVVPADATTEGVLDDYRRACDHARTLVAARSLDHPTARPHWYFGITTVRFAVFHLVRETARHAGHLDVLRELTDGTTGF